MSKVAVLGAGSWGTALSIVLADNGHDVRLWTHRKEQADEINETNQNSRYLEISLPKSITAYHDIELALEEVEALVLVVPTNAIREVCQKIKNILEDEFGIQIARRTIMKYREQLHIPSSTNRRRKN